MRDTEVIEIAASLDRGEVEGKVEREHRLAQPVVGFEVRVFGVRAQFGRRPERLTRRKQTRRPADLTI